MMNCLDEDAILSFCQGSMSPMERRAVEGHLAACDECRALVSAVIKSSMVEPPAAPESNPETASTTPAQGLSAPPDAFPRKAIIDAPVLPGDVLGGKYVVERILGSGGMGVVVAARHAQLKQRVALKFLLHAACEAPGAIERFLREGQAAARITSEHVARVTDTGVLESGSPYLVMEYLEGKDLGEVVAEQGPLPVETAVDYVLQACEAIVEAHQLGIVHRDLKPANLFLTRRNDGSPLVKVLDFGISKTEGGSSAHLTSTTTLMGSPRYMSPEQMVSAKEVDARTDIWALGIITFELLSGEPVWKADTVQGLCALIATAPPPRLRDLVPNVPPELEQVIERCLAKPRNERIPSIADLALALLPVAPPHSRLSIERILRVAGRSVDLALSKGESLTGATSELPVPAPLTSSTRRLVLAALLVVLSAGLAVVLTLALQRQGRTEPATAAERHAEEKVAAPWSSTVPSQPEPSSAQGAAAEAKAPAASDVTSLMPAGTASALSTKTTTPPRRRLPKTLVPADLVDLPNPSVTPPAPQPTSRALSDRK